MSAPEEARELLAIAERELTSLRAMLSPQIATEVFGFVAQQALEKSLKAWLTAIGVTYPRVHDLFALIALLAQYQQDVEWLPEMSDMNPYAVELRYTSPPTPLDLDRQDAIERVERVVERVKGLVAEAPPTA